MIWVLFTLRLFDTVSIRFSLTFTLIDFDFRHFSSIKLQFILLLLRIKKRCFFIFLGFMNWSLLCVIVYQFLVIVLNCRDCFGLCLWQSVKSLWCLNFKWRQKLFLIILKIFIFIKFLFDFIIFSKAIFIMIFRYIIVIGWNGWNVPP